MGALGEQWYLRRLDRGLFTLQMVDRLIAEFLTGFGASEDNELGVRLRKVLDRKGISDEQLKSTLLEYLDNLGDGDDDQSIVAIERERIRIELLLERLQ